MMHHGADSLSTILSVLGLRARFRARTELTQQHKLDFEAAPHRFLIHVCVSGKSLLLDAASTVHPLGANEIALVPGSAHRITSQNGTSVVLSGECDFDPSAEHVVLRGLDRVMSVSAEAIASFGWMRDTVDLLNLETHNRSPGALSIASRAFEILFVQALRSFAVSQRGDAPPTGFMAALADPALRGVLDAMHAKPAEHWTVEKLADEVALSRSTFAERFHAVVGVPPMQYLTDWRMQLARSMLVTTQRSVAEIARDAGYDSAAGFRRRFKAQQGSSPTAFRRRVQP